MVNNIDRRTVARNLVGPLVLAALLISCTAASAADPDQGAVGDWLSRYASARSVGMGGAVVAAADAPTAALFNPAAVGRLRQFELEAGTVRLFEDTSVNTFSLVLPAGRRVGVGINLITLKSGEFERTSELNEPLGEFTEGDFAAVLSGALSLSTHWTAGASLRMLRQRVDDFSGSGAGIDLGIAGELSETLHVGASVLNLGGPKLTLRDTEESVPTELRGGMALRLLDGRGLVAAELSQRDGPGTESHAGAEFWLHDSMALRAGYYGGEIAGGFSYQSDAGWTFDYGLSDHLLGVTHRFGFRFRFGGFNARAEALPAVFSPTGSNPVTRIRMNARTRDEARQWALDIVDENGAAVRTFGGQGLPPAQVLWDGKGESGLPLPDGVYRYRLTVSDVVGRVIESRELQVEIFTGGPEGAVPVEIE